MTDFLDIDEMDVLESPIVRLTLEVHTASAPEAGSDDPVYCNVVFSDGTLLFDPVNHRLGPDTPSLLFLSNSTHEFELPLPAGLRKSVADIAEFYIRKAGANGWLLGSALLFANGHSKPVLGNSQINQFLDDAGHALFISDWSTRSLCASGAAPAKHPLLCPHYRIAGPVLGHVSDHAATIVYRVDREGRYRLRVTKVATGEIVAIQIRTLAPTATYDIEALEPDTHYRFSLFHAYLGHDIPVPASDGEFRTFPREDAGVRFSFAFGSCCRNSHDPAQNAWTGIRHLAADPAVSPLPGPPNNVRFFMHLGDTFYFYDEVTESEPHNLRTMLAAHLSQRRHPGFLDMARIVPSCAVWDDHDFRKDDLGSVGFEDKVASVTAFRRYWGNKPLGPQFGLADNLTTLITYGNVDIYLLDGRFHRDQKHGVLTRAGVCFGKKEQLDTLVGLIRARLQITGTSNRLVILASSATWNHTEKDSSRQAYGNDVFEEERESFYSDLNGLIHASVIKGLVFLSGDIHINEIYEISLASAAGLSTVVAPEFVSSPLGRNSGLKDARERKDERKRSHSSKDNGRGFATLEIDTRSEEPQGNWTLRVRYYEANSSVAAPYMTQSYRLDEGQFPYIS